MKQDLTEKQYIQIAKAKFCDLIYKVSSVSDVEILNAGLQRDFGDFSAVVRFSDSCEKQRIFFEVKSSGEKHFASIFASRASQYHDDSVYVFSAPYISEQTADFLKENGYGYMDLSGNCYIASKRIFISVSGKPNQYIVKREKKNYFSKSSEAVSTILRFMLNEPNRMWKVQELAEVSHKAIGMVSNVKSFLKDRELIEEQGRLFRISDYKELLYSWSKDYQKKDSIVKEYYSFDGIPDIEKKISEWSISHDNGALLGGFSAAARYAPSVRYNKVNVYVNEECLYEFVKDFELKEVDSGGNVIVTIPHDITPCMFYRNINSSLVVSPVQTVLDLLGMPARGEEAANAIIVKEFIR